MTKNRSVMIKEPDFEDIRPYFDYEINPALKRIISDPAFDKILDFLGITTAGGFTVKNLGPVIQGTTGPRQTSRPPKLFS